MQERRVAATRGSAQVLSAAIVLFLWSPQTIARYSSASLSSTEVLYLAHCWIQFDFQSSAIQHLIMAQTMGIKQLIVCVTKMDLPGVLWDESAFSAVRESVGKGTRKAGYVAPEFIPISAEFGTRFLFISIMTICILLTCLTFA